MQLIYFTKFLVGFSCEKVAESAKGLGFAGLDLAIRPGQAVNPDNVSEALPGAMKVFGAVGLSVPMATLPTDLVSPQEERAERIWAACGKAGVANIKLGYWHFQPDKPYRGQVDAIRRDIEAFARLSEKHGPKAVHHTHSGNCMGLNASATMDLIQGFDPRHVGAYIDPAHLTVCGEPLPMALAIVSGYLSVIGVKNVCHVSNEDAGTTVWHPRWVMLREGLVDWRKAVPILHDAGFDGPLTVHGEYSHTEDPEKVLALVREEMAYLKPIVAALGK